MLELLARAPDPEAAAKLTTVQVSAVLKRAHRRRVVGKTAVIRVALAAVIVTLNQQIAALERQVEAYFLAHPDAGDRVVPARAGPDPRRQDARRVRRRSGTVCQR